ncbi:uncharacterized protein LOC116298482 [Actinia tenebrosa]|uniref:Uncharacterized protein LOC116298482 n=1 Tax=Actinia tenebrosa TaxID=6105 RepID=A0A6P8IBG8_ACTTE|nr:uncharacterized protein LOC116298482 [Actinia tenebrosa]
MCSNDFRQQIKKMAKADPENLSLNLEESQDSDHNLVIFNQVKDELYHSYGGEGKCPWTVLQMKVALKTYMRSLRASAKRKAKGNNQEHVRSCRRQNRKKEKLGRRLKSLDSKKWSNEKKAKIASCLHPDYISSEESEVEEEEPFKTVAYIVKPLNWESQELKKAKKSLDKHHKDSLPDLVKRRVIPRRNGHPSRRQKPNDCPDWACLQ